MDESAYEEVGGEAGARVLLICDHATNRVPDSVAGGDLGLPPEEMARHIAMTSGRAGWRWSWRG